MRELKAAVLGVGQFGRHHARIYSDMAAQNVRLVGLVDVDPVGPRAIADRLGVPLVDRLEALPEQPDLVSVAVPTTVHRPMAEPLLRRGIHCLVEKPIAGSTTDAHRLVQAAEAGSAHLQVGLVERFNPVMAALDRLGEPPVYIEVHRLAPFSLRAADVGVVMDMMIHDLDIVNHAVGEEAVSVEAVGVSVASAREDVANARITFPSGCVANVTASRVSQQRVRRIRIFSANAYLSLDYDLREARIVRPSPRLRGWNSRVAHLAAQQPGLDPTRTSGERADFEELLRTERLALSDREPLRDEILALVQAVRTGRRPLVGGSEGLRALELAERILAELARNAPRSPDATTA